jgi:uncharacterized ParB-like nuclease family protein
MNLGDLYSFFGANTPQTGMTLGNLASGWLTQQMASVHQAGQQAQQRAQMLINNDPAYAQSIPDQPAVQMAMGLAPMGGKMPPLFPKAGNEVSGLTVRDSVPNTSSIASSLDDYAIQPGIREVPFSEFNGPGPMTDRVKNLASQIQQSGEINPLIVVRDAEGHYILEGAHRYDALQHLGYKTFPAMVVDDLDSLGTLQ